MVSKKENIKSNIQGDFPGSPGVKTLHFHYWRLGFSPWLGN